MAELRHRPERMLVTGGAGFIGSNFVHLLLAADAELRIVNLDLLTYAGSLQNLAGLESNPRYHFVRGDVCNAGLVEYLLREHQIDTVVHFAAESHVDRSIDGPAAFVRTNVNGTFTMLDAVRLYWQSDDWRGRKAQRTTRFHHISTDEVFGTLGPDDPAFSETTPYAPNSPYSAAKAGADHLVRAYHHTYKLPVVTTNCSNNYGPRQHGEKLLPTVIRSCFLEKPIPVYGNGSNIRDWLYVDDHCRGIQCVLERGELGSSYNIGGKSERSNLELVKLVCRVMDELHPRLGARPHEQLIQFVTDRPGHDWRYAIDCSKLEGELGFVPQETLESGLRRTVSWYLNDPAWRAGVAAGTVSGARLGLSGAAGGSVGSGALPGGRK
ncbi:MAG: dTDP-glucose 4,6-dehydratase [Planctomycetota bacterium]